MDNIIFYSPYSSWSSSSSWGVRRRCLFLIMKRKNSCELDEVKIMFLSNNLKSRALGPKNENNRQKLTHAGHKSCVQVEETGFSAQFEVYTHSQPHPQDPLDHVFWKKKLGLLANQTWMNDGTEEHFITIMKIIDSKMTTTIMVLLRSFTFFKPGHLIKQSTHARN